MVCIAFDVPRVNKICFSRLVLVLLLVLSQWLGVFESAWDRFVGIFKTFIHECVVGHHDNPSLDKSRVFLFAAAFLPSFSALQELPVKASSNAEMLYRLVPPDLGQYFFRHKAVFVSEVIPWLDLNEEQIPRIVWWSSYSIVFQPILVVRKWKIWKCEANRRNRKTITMMKRKIENGPGSRSRGRFQREHYVKLVLLVRTSDQNQKVWKKWFSWHDSNNDRASGWKISHQHKRLQFPYPFRSRILVWQQRQKKCQH